MHAPPFFQTTVSRYGAWRVASAALVGLSGVVALAWMPAAAQQPAWTIVLVAFTWFVASAAILVMARRLGPTQLRWDTQQWAIRRSNDSGREFHAGRLTVCIDLGHWLLLHFRPDNASFLARGIWLPVQRRGHESAWHALRCTVYSARPVTPPAVAPF